MPAQRYLLVAVFSHRAGFHSGSSFSRDGRSGAIVPKVEEILELVASGLSWLRSDVVMAVRRGQALCRRGRCPIGRLVEVDTLLYVAMAGV